MEKPFRFVIDDSDPNNRYWRLVNFVQHWMLEHPNEFPPGFIEEYNQNHAPILRVIAEEYEPCNERPRKLRKLWD